ncbi:MAG TPA: TraB/GumN family protein, partial [Chromatiales bacterium]|nr:TraB/GumN family protein [Chromatiales bacterium]
MRLVDSCSAEHTGCDAKMRRETAWNRVTEALQQENQGMVMKFCRPGVMLLLLLVCQPGWAADETGILWEVSRDGSRPSYLLGTIHSGDSRILKLPDAIERAFTTADSFSGEVEMDRNSLLQVSEAMFYADGTLLKDRLDPRLYQHTVRLMATHGLPEMVVQRMKPWAVATTLSLPRTSTGQVLDM